MATCCHRFRDFNSGTIFDIGKMFQLWLKSTSYVRPDIMTFATNISKSKGKGKYQNIWPDTMAYHFHKIYSRRIFLSSQTGKQAQKAIKKKMCPTVDNFSHKTKVVGQH